MAEERLQRRLAAILSADVAPTPHRAHHCHLAALGSVLRVLGHPEILEPIGNLLHRRPPCRLTDNDHNQKLSNIPKHVVAAALPHVREWDGPAVLLPLTAFDRGLEARGGRRHVAEDRRCGRKHHWH